MSKILLNGKWQRSLLGKAPWFPIKIPNNWETGGVTNYKGTIMFRRSFIVNDLETNKEYWLKFYGVDYYACVYLNGVHLGNHTGYFQPFEFRVSKYLKKGKNTLLVKVNSGPEVLSNWPHEKRTIKGIFGHHDIRPGSWHPKHGQNNSTGGIWNDVELEITDKIRIKNIYINSLPKLRVVVEIENLSKKTQNILIKTNFGTKLQKNIQPGIQNISFLCKISNPRLWWTWDHGTPHLYALELSLETKEGIKIKKDTKFGIRTITFDKDQNLYLNGKRIFIRGSNIIPEEYLSQYSQSRINKDIKLAKEANINALRPHAHVNRREFYEACDREGILLWQDFPLQWEYHSDKAFLKEAKRQIRDMVLHLYNHPSIFLWCCHNEPLKSKNITGPLLSKEVKKIDNTRAIINSSNFEEHPYPGWFVGKMEHFAALPGSPLPSEFGAQAIPSLASLRKIIPNKYLWPPDWKHWAYKNFVYEQTFYIAGIPKPKNINHFINDSQNYQAKLLKCAIECYRIAKFSKINGIFQFMLVDPWPCISYSVLDYFRKKKKGYEALKAAYQPILIVYHHERDTLTVADKIRGQFYLINDNLSGFKNVTLKVKLGKYSFPSKKINIPANCAIWANKLVYPLPLPKKLKAGKYDFTLELIDKKGKVVSKNTYEIKLGNVPDGIMPYNAQLF